MRGSINNQVKTLSIKIYQKGMSKELQRETGKIANDRTVQTYAEVWKEFGNYMKNELNVKDFQKINSEHIQSYLNMKFDGNISEKRAQIISSALGKLETALKIVADKFGNADPEQYNWRKERINIVKNARKDGLIKVQKDYTRAYKDPKALNENITRLEHKLASKIQLEGGARLEPMVKGIRETIRVNPKKMEFNKLGHLKQITPGTYNQLQGLTKDKFTGKTVGQILTVEKGGKPGLVSVSEDTYNQIVEYINKNKVLKVNPDLYRNDLKAAAKASGQKYEATHGQRWNFAQNRIEALQNNGMKYEAAKQLVSWEMKHFRREITEHYLR